jgi:hypothetical protein
MAVFVNITRLWEKYSKIFNSAPNWARPKSFDGRTHFWMVYKMQFFNWQFLQIFFATFFAPRLRSVGHNYWKGGILGMKPTQKDAPRMYPPATEIWLQKIGFFTSYAQNS